MNFQTIYPISSIFRYYNLRQYKLYTKIIILYARYNMHLNSAYIHTLYNMQTFHTSIWMWNICCSEIYLQYENVKFYYHTTFIWKVYTHFLAYIITIAAFSFSYASDISDIICIKCFVYDPWQNLPETIASSAASMTTSLYWWHVLKLNYLLLCV